MGLESGEKVLGLGLFGPPPALRSLRDQRVFLPHFQTWAVSLFLAYKALPAMGIQKNVDAIAHLLGIAVPVFTSYIGHKRFSFKE